MLLEVTVGPTGAVEEVRAIMGLPLGLTEAAAEAVRQWSYEPVRADGAPATVVYVQVVDFRVREPGEAAPPVAGDGRP